MILFKNEIEKIQNSEKNFLNDVHEKLSKGEQAIFKNIDLNNFADIFETMQYCCKSDSFKIRAIVQPNYMQTFGKITYFLNYDYKAESFVIYIESELPHNDAKIRMSINSFKEVMYYTNDSWGSRYEPLSNIDKANMLCAANDKGSIGIRGFVLNNSTLHILLIADLLAIYQDLKDTFQKYIQYVIETLENNIKNALK